MRMREIAARELRESAELKLRCAETLSPAIEKAAEMLVECLKGGGKLLFCGNGGSAADSQHIAAEFVNRYVDERPAIGAIALTTDTSNLTSIANDRGYEEVFSRQVAALGRKGDLLVGISTSGKSPNVLKALEEARTRGLKTVALSGRDGGPVARAADHAIVVPEKVTSRIQEVHITVGHILCGLVDAELHGRRAPEYGVA